MLNKYYLADRSNKTIDILDLSTEPRPSHKSSTPNFQASLATTTPPVPTAWRPSTTTRRFGSETPAALASHLDPNCGPGQVWVLNTDASVKTLPGGAKNPISVGGTTRADELCYDSKDNLVMIASPGRVAALRHLHLDHGRSLYSCWQARV